MPNLLKLKRGLAATIPTASLAEPLFTTDTYDLYIGNGSGNTRFQKYIASGTSSQFLKGDGSLDSTSYQTALSFSSPLVNTSGTISIPVATSSANGYLSSTDWSTFNSKEPAITAGTSLQYYRGDKTFQTLNTSVVPESGAIYFTEPRVLATVLTGLNLSGGGTIAATDSILTAFGKVQNQISALVGGATYQGVWNASTNSPSLASGVGTKGYYYVVSVAGSTNLDGITDWKVGDWAIFNGTAWDKVDNTDAVSSVNGFTGAVNLGLGDISNVALSSPTNAQLLRFNGTSSKWENWTPTYISAAITSLNGLTAATQTFAVGTNGTDFAISSSTSTHTFNLPTASATNRGALSSADWTTFNNKQAALTFGNLTEATSSVLTITGGTGAVIGSGTSIEVKSASATQNGVVTTGTQTIAGAKTFSSSLVSQGSVTAANNFIFSAGTGNTGLYYGHTDRVVLANYTAGGIDFETNGGTIYMTLFPSGNLAVKASATDAGYKLDVDGTGRFTGALSGTSATFSSSVSADSYKLSANSGKYYYLDTATGNNFLGLEATNTFALYVGGVKALGIASTGAATFSAASAASTLTTNAAAGQWSIRVNGNSTAGSSYGLGVYAGTNSSDDSFRVHSYSGTEYFKVRGDGAATFSSSVTAGGNIVLNSSAQYPRFVANSTYGAGSAAGINFQDNSVDKWAIAYSNSLNGLQFYQEGVGTNVFFKNGGNVGIGTSSPNSFSSAANQLVVGTTSGNNGITVAAGTTGFSSIYFADGTTGNEAYRGYIEYGHTADSLNFATNATERMRITSGGTTQIKKGDGNDALQVYGSGASSYLFMKSTASYATIGSYTTGTGYLPIYIEGSEVWMGYTTDQGAYLLQVNGSVYASAYYESSDIRLKNILNTKASDNFSAIEFNWKDARDNKKHWGYAAQDVMKFIPDAIEVNKDGMMTVNYNEAHTWKIAQLEAKIKELESKLAN